MEIKRRALYNSLRMNWIMDPTLAVESWQVEDYRAMPLDILFEKLEDEHIRLDRSSFLVYADTVDNPEDLTDTLLAGTNKDNKTQDQVYLLIFELWRRLLPEKPTLSIFCDEMDYQIHLYDRGQSESVEAIQDALSNLQMILDENTDEGADPVEAFECLEAGCANDIESFLYDFIADEVDNENYSYANELLEGFGNYVRDVKWFEFLKARVVAATDPNEANRMIKRLVEGKSKNHDLTFNLEVLSFLVAIGEKEIFERLVKKTTELLETEEDFQSLVSICADFYHRLDHEKVEQSLQFILNNRVHYDLNKSFDDQDPHLAEFFKIISKTAK